MRKLVVAGVAAALIAGGGAGAYTLHRVAVKAEACERVTTMRETLAADRATHAEGDGPLIAVLGDSYTQGNTTHTALDAFPYVTGDELGARVFADGTGATGYVAEGPCGDGAFIDRVDDVLATNPDVLIIAGGVNDQGRPGQNEAVRALFDEVEQRAGLEVVILSPHETPATETDKITETAGILNAAANDYGFTYIDVRGWDFELLPDQMHPTVQGHKKIGQELAEALKLSGDLD